MTGRLYAGLAEPRLPGSLPRTVRNVDSLVRYGLTRTPPLHSLHPPAHLWYPATPALQHPDGYVCAACLKNHRENSAFLPGHHFLVTDGAAPCGFVLAELGIPPSSGSCGRHPDQFLTVRCMGCPDRPFLCDTCRPGHAGHDIAVISDLVPGELEGLLKAIYGPLHLPDGTAAPTPLLAPTLASTLRQRTRLAGLRTRPTAAARKPLSASALVSVSPEDMKEAMKILESVGGSPEFLHALSASPLAITAAATTGARMSRFGIAGKDVVIDGLEQAGFAIPPGGTLRFQMGLSPEAAILLGPVASAACAAIGGGVTAAAVLMHDLMGATKVVATVMHPPSAADGAPSAPPVEVTPVIRLSMRGCIEVLLRLPPGTPDHSTLRVEEIVVSALPLNVGAGGVLRLISGLAVHPPPPSRAAPKDHPRYHRRRPRAGRAPAQARPPRPREHKLAAPAELRRRQRARAARRPASPPRPGRRRYDPLRRAQGRHVLPQVRRANRLRRLARGACGRAGERGEQGLA